MGRTDVESRVGVLRADLAALREFAALCESTADDLDAVVTRAAAAASRLSGPGGCAEAFRVLCDDAGRHAVDLLRESTGRVRKEGQRLGRVANALRNSDQESARSVEGVRRVSDAGAL